MKNLIFTLVLCAAALGLRAADLEGKFVKTDGTVIEGKTVNYRPEGVTFRYSAGPDAGRFSQRIPWRQFDQATLKFFATDPAAREFAALFIEMAPEEMDDELVRLMEREPPPPVVISDVPAPGRNHAGVGMVAALFSGGGFFVFLLLFAANIYAAYEIAAFRRIPIAAACGGAVVLPFIAPIVAICIPTQRKRKKKKVVEESLEEQEYEAYEGGEAYAGAEGYDEYAAEVVEPLVEEPAVPVELPETQVFERGRCNLNRRFIETKFSGFFRVVPPDDVKDMELVIKSARGEFHTSRILKATNTEIAVQVQKAEGATVDESIPLNDLIEIRLKHKYAPE